MKREMIGFTGWRAMITGLVILMMVPAARAAEISIPDLKTTPGMAVTIPVMLDHVDNLAGVKLVMTYDPKVLTFSKADKTKFTNSMMHIVNDKKPGTLIAVMAAARGIKGDKFPILTLEFRVNAAVEAPAEAALEIREAQLMSDDLKDLPYTVNIPPLKILSAAPPEIPERPDKPAKAKPASPPKKEDKPSDATAKGEGVSTCPFELESTHH